MSAGAFIFRHGAVIRKREGFSWYPFCRSGGSRCSQDSNSHALPSWALWVPKLSGCQNLSTLLQRMNHILGIFSGTVHPSLVTVIHMDAEAFHCPPRTHFQNALRSWGSHHHRDWARPHKDSRYTRPRGFSPSGLAILATFTGIFGACRIHPREKKPRFLSPAS